MSIRSIFFTFYTIGSRLLFISQVSIVFYSSRFRILEELTFYCTVCTFSEKYFSVLDHFWGETFPPRNAEISPQGEISPRLRTPELDNKRIIYLISDNNKNT